MQQVLRTAWRCALLDRDAYSGLHFDQYATANAVILVAAVGAIEAIVVALRSQLSNIVILVLSVVVESLASWAISTGILWLAATKLFHGAGRFEQALRMTGYAWLPFLLLSLAAVGLLPVVSGVSALIFAAFVWYGAGLYVISQVLFELTPRNAVAAALLGAVGWLVVRFLFGF